MKGFTVIEFLISVAIIFSIGALGLFIGMDFYKSSSFNSERQTAISILQKVRNLSMANINEAKHGVYLGTDKYTIFQGENYSSRNSAYDELIYINPTITKDGLQEVVFEQLTGKPSAIGNIILSDRTRSITISIENEGRINW
jgi:Tfp pilus assembly protein PilE